MKYKKIIKDNQIDKKLEIRNIAEIARRMNVSKTYLYEAIKEKFAVTEEFYKRLLEVVD